MDPLVGSLVDGRYKILAAMASGSMGAVYKAERVPIGKLVAVKFLHASFATDPEFLARFERETRVMSKLAHPNCVSVVDFGVFDDAPYIVMDYVDGTTLRAILDDELVAPPRALAIARQLAAGLAHAHTQGIVHRDVKPANIMIGQAIGAGEVVRVLDFGLARLRGPQAGRDPTQANVVVGTPNYMAPEQTLAGGTLDARTDIYAVGVVLFEMITGDRPFVADDTVTILAMHRTAPIPRLAERAPADVVLPEGLQEVVDKAMAKDPAARYQSAIELATALEALSAAIASATQRPLATVARRTDADAAVDASAVTAVAPTLVDAGSPPVPRSSRRSPRRRGIALAALLVLGAGVVVYKARDPGADPAAVVAGAPLAPAAVARVDAAVLAPVPLDAAEAVEDPVADLADLPEIEFEPDPLTAEDLTPVDPTAAAAQDEAEDAPTEAPADEPPPATAQKLARSVHAAVVLIQRGQKDLALQSLRALWKQQQHSGYIPFLLGNLYFDRRWWSVSLDHYGKAIGKNAGYKKNQVLIRNVIKMLGSSKTMSRAERFLKRTVGRSARTALQRAAKGDPNALVRKRAATLAKAM